MSGLRLYMFIHRFAWFFSDTRILVRRVKRELQLKGRAFFWPIEKFMRTAKGSAVAAVTGFIVGVTIMVMIPTMKTEAFPSYQRQSQKDGLACWTESDISSKEAPPEAAVVLRWQQSQIDQLDRRVVELLEMSYSTEAERQECEARSASCSGSATTKEEEVARLKQRLQTVEAAAAQAQKEILSLTKQEEKMRRDMAIQAGTSSRQISKLEEKLALREGKMNQLETLLAKHGIKTPEQEETERRKLAAKIAAETLRQEEAAKQEVYRENMQNLRWCMWEVVDEDDENWPPNWCYSLAEQMHCKYRNTGSEDGFWPFLDCN